jgi:hypothetical protein
MEYFTICSGSLNEIGGMRIDGGCTFNRAYARPHFPYTH